MTRERLNTTLIESTTYDERQAMKQRRNLTDAERNAIRNLVSSSSIILRRLDIEAEETDEPFPCRSLRDDLRRDLDRFRDLFGYDL